MEGGRGVLQCQERKARRRQTAQRRQRGGSSAEAAARRLRRWRQRDTTTSVVACWRLGSVGSAKHGGGKQCDGSSAVAAAWRLQRWRQRYTATSAVACWRRGSVSSVSRCGSSANHGSGAQWQQHSWRNTEAAADSPAPSTNAPTHAPSDAQMRRCTRWNVETYWWLVGCGSITLWLHKSCHMTTRDFTRTTPTCLGIHTCMWVQLLSPKLEDNTISV